MTSSSSKSNQEDIRCLDLKSKNIDDKSNIFLEIHTSYPNIVNLDLSENNLTSLPLTLAQFTKLQALDIRDNPFKSHLQVASSLSTLPQLLSLSLDLNTPEHVSLILKSLPRLQLLNGKSTKEDDGLAIDLEDSEINSISLDNEKPLFTEIYSTVSKRLETLNKDISTSFLKNFEELLMIEIDKINKCVEMNSPNYVYATHVIDSVITILNYFNLSYYAFLDIKDIETSALMKKINNHYHMTTRKLIDIVYKLQPKIEERADMISANNKRAVNKENSVKECHNDICSQRELKLKESEALIKHYQEKIKLSKMKLESLENENKIMMSKLFTKARTIINRNALPLSSSVQEHKSFQAMNNPLSLNKSNRPIGDLRSCQKLNAVNSSSRVFTVKMMKDFINDLYNSKADFNKMCDENRLPRETMEQHMYTHLNHKFGLKSIIIEWATNIINAIRAFSSDNSEVCLFGKILRNELEEDSRQFLPLLKAKINERLSFYLRTKYYLKSVGDINDMQQRMIASSLPEEEWKTIIYSLYEEADALLLEKRLVDIIIERNSLARSIAKESVLNSKMTREEITQLAQQKEDTGIGYKELVQVLHDFQIRSREKYLKHFIRLFKKVDQDNNGILNEDEFIQLIASFNIYPNSSLTAHTNRLLALIDPNNNKQITFSECITLFSKETLEEKDHEKGSINILDKMCLDNLTD